MSGFDPAWLALREPADNAARNSAILDACAAHFADRAHGISVVDIGCGSGSNLRALAPHLPTLQQWRLIDHDPALLAAARGALCAWADSAEETAEGGLALRRNGKQLHVRFIQLDLAGDLQDALAAPADLVTAAALFDLVSEGWTSAFCEILARHATPLYAALTYDGVDRWTPPHAADEVMLAAFHAHQAGDKGFGPAAGPRAGDVLCSRLAAHCYSVSSGRSDWRLADGDRTLVEQLADGIAQACRETALVDEKTIEDWRLSRRAAHAQIGHTDIFASRA